MDRINDFFEMAYSESIAIITTNYGSPFMSYVMNGVELAAQSILGERTMLSVYCTYSDQKVKENLLNDILLGKLAMAVIMLYIKPDLRQAENYARAGIPIIMVENRFKGVSSVGIENKKASYEAVKHLISRGKKRIAIISGLTLGEAENENLVMAEREDGYKQALQEAGIAIDARLMTEKSRYYTFDEGYEFLEKILKHGGKPDAVFCASGDFVSMGIMAKAKELGIRIPEDLAVVGYDDVVAARLVDPPLTTIRQPIEKIGREALRLAYESAKGKITKPVDIILPSELIVRKST